MSTRALRQLLGAAVAVTAMVLALAPTAFADGWTLQSVPTSTNSTGSALEGVACPYPGTYKPTSPCFAVGYEGLRTGQQSALIEYWDGSAWSVWQSGGPPSSTSSELRSVSCPSPAFCMAAGDYESGGTDFPLAYTFQNGRWVQQNVPGNPFSSNLSSVSCQSASFCVAVGSDLPIEIWNGSVFTAQPSPSNDPRIGELSAVSCAAATPGFCLAVGSTFGGNNTVFPYAEAYENGQWIAQDNPADGYFAARPSNTTYSRLDGVYCLTAQSCQVAGYSTAGLWGAQLNGNTWTFESLPPNNAFAAPGTGGNDLTCPNECWLVGNYESPSGWHVFANEFNGTWEFASLPTPTGALAPILNAVSCAEQNYCEAVGTTGNAQGDVAFAEHFFYTPPSGCQHPPCRPPLPGTPHNFALNTHGTVALGATVIAALHKRRTLVLLVKQARRRAIIGEVPLGRYPAGTSEILNVRVDHQLLTPRQLPRRPALDLRRRGPPDTPPGRSW